MKTSKKTFFSKYVFISEKCFPIKLMAFNCHFHSLKNKWAFNNRDTLKMIDVNLQKVSKRRKQCHLVYVCLLLLFQVYFWDTSKSILNNSVKKYIYLYLSVHLKTFDLSSILFNNRICKFNILVDRFAYTS